MLQDVKKRFASEDGVDLSPESAMFFPYPVEADEGRGFGCKILLLVVEKNERLIKLFDTVREGELVMCTFVVCP